MKIQHTLIKMARGAHNSLCWMALLTLATFMLSALAHIAASWLPSGEPKQWLQFIFRQLHTLAFLEDIPGLRLILVLLMSSCVLAMLSAGVTLLLLLRRRQATEARRRHRLLACLMALPLLGFTASGLFHLFYMEFGPVEEEVKQQKLAHEAGIHREAPPRTDATGRAEQLTFRHLHMWNFIKPVAGKPGRDAVLLVLLLLLLLLAAAGWRLKCHDSCHGRL